MSLLKQSSTNTSSVNVGNFQNAEIGVKDYFKKKKADASKFITHTKEKRQESNAKKRSDKAGHTILLALMKANTIIDSEKQHAWAVEKKQRRTEKAPESGDENARKELETSIRNEVWSELELTRRKNHKSGAFGQEILGAFDILSAKN